jgi:LDH2 family malate/lactate/ureidoglycolate dehydrogenase
LPDEPAGAAAEVLVRTTARGVDSHGVSYLHQYVEQLRQGGAKHRARLTPLLEQGPLAVMDGGAGLGPAIAAEATAGAIARARAYGLSLTTVRNANHFGAAGHYALVCAEAGCVGLVLSNTPPIMAATGARGRSVGNSPLAFGAPRSDGPPVVLDIAMSRVAGGKIRMAAQDGREVPLGWILDPEGNPTTDPADFLLHRGALEPMEGHKGYGLSLMVETLAGALSGAAMLGAVGNWLYAPERPSDTGYFLLVIDTGPGSAFPDLAERVHALCEEVTAAPRAPGVDRILVPGELEHEAEQRAHAEGVVLPQPVRERFQHLADTLADRALTEILDYV